MEFVVDNKQIENLRLRLGRFNKDIQDKKILNIIAQQIRDNIYLRTNAGIDVRYNAFKPYNKSYAKRKGKTTVNLTDTAQMIKSMTQKILSNDTAMIFFNGQHKGGFSNSDLAKWHNEGLGKQPMREFFGLSSKDRTEAFSYYKKEVVRVKKELKL